MDQNQAERIRVKEANLRSALVELSHNLKSKNDVSLVKYILLDRHNANTVLDYFERLMQSQEISVNNVSIIYELLFLMRKNSLWAKFRKNLADCGHNVPDYNYIDEKEFTNFTGFRQSMINTGHQVSVNDLPGIKVMYEVQGDFNSVWETFLHLEKMVKVENEKKSLLKFEKNLNANKNFQAASIIHKYVDMEFSSKGACAKPVGHIEHSDIDGKTDVLKHQKSFEVEIVMTEIEKRKSRVDTLKRKVTESAKQSKEFIQRTGEQLKNKIGQKVNEQIHELEKSKNRKLEKLDKYAGDLEEYSQFLINYDPEKTEDGSFVLDEDFYPESVGYLITNTIKNISNDLSRFEDTINEYCQFVDYKPVDATECCINVSEMKNGTLDTNEILSVRVDLKDSYGNNVRNDHESAPITVKVEHEIPEKSSDYELTRTQPCLLNFKFKSTGLWKLYICIGGELVIKPINLKVIPGMSLIRTVDVTQFGAPMFDVCFFSDGRQILACNNTNIIFSFSSIQSNYKEFSSLSKEEKVSNLCCVDKNIFLTEVTKKEIVVLNGRGSVCSRFGKGDFEDGAPQGIAATHNSGAVHVFVSNNEGKCVQHYVNKVLCKTITEIFNPSTRKSISPWFLGVNNDLQLFICNDKATSSNQEDTSNRCFVDVLNVKSKTLVNSLKCDSAVCIDEKFNVFVGMSFGIKMFDKDLKFVKEVTYSVDYSFGLSAFSGCLAVVHAGSIKLYRY